MATYRDFSNEFLKHPDSDDIVTKIDEVAIRQAIRNLFFAEKPFHPEIGINLYRMLFENFDPVTEIAIKRSILQTLSMFEPRAKILTLDLIQNDEEDGIYISISFQVLNKTEVSTISIFIERLR